MTKREKNEGIATFLLKIKKGNFTVSRARDSFGFLEEGQGMVGSISQKAKCIIYFSIS